MDLSPSSSRSSSASSSPDQFLPVSSTGHPIILGDLLGYNDDTSSSSFKIVISSPPSLAVCWDYRGSA